MHAKIPLYPGDFFCAAASRYRNAVHRSVEKLPSCRCDKHQVMPKDSTRPITEGGHLHFALAHKSRRIALVGSWARMLLLGETSPDEARNGMQSNTGCAPHESHRGSKLEHGCSSARGDD